MAASKKFEEAYQLAVDVGPTVESERLEVIEGLTAVRLSLAERAIGRGDLKEAREQVRRVILVNPQDPRAIALQAEVDKRIQDRLGKEPSDAVLERLPDFQTERVNTSVLVNDARLLMEMGKLDEAEAKLKQAVKEDPEHRAAFYYLSLITERRYAQEARKREVMAKERMVEVEEAWNTPMTRDTLPMANPYARTNTIHTSSARAGIARKLEVITLDQWYIPGDIPLSEVIKELDEEAKKRDPDQRGINFIISSVVDRPGPQLPAGGFGPGGFPGGGIDPLTGAPLPVATASENPVVVEDFLVKIDPPLKNVRLIDVLDAIVKVAKAPPGVDQSVTIKYSIEDYAVVFSQRSAEAEPLYTRTYRVDPNTFVQGLDGIFFTQSPFLGLAAGGGGGGIGGAGGGGGIGGGGLGGGGAGGTTAGTALPGGYFSFSGSGGGAGGGGGLGGGGGGGQTAGGGGILGVTITNSMASIQDAVRAFFVAAGIDFQTNQAAFGQVPGQFGGGAAPPQKAIFFNDRTGVLFVRATLRDLDIIEGALQALNITPPQVTIETKFAEITQRDDKAVGFDWFLGNTLFNDQKAGVSGGTAPSYANSGGEANPANPGGTFPGNFGIPYQLPNSETDQRITNPLASNAGIPAVATVTGILTDPQFRVVIRALESRGGVDLLSAPKVTTVSGRQARISIEDTQTIIIGLGVQGLGGGAGGGLGGGGVGVPGGFTAPVAP